ncbi:hypothetical protein EDC04DRAFT_2611232 [Pisolithus marmoratus]|nr:hypothetical protein EDC04DRAFT_2611232 [Pisolithus marmoratus]
MSPSVSSSPQSALPFLMPNTWVHPSGLVQMPWQDFHQSGTGNKSVIHVMSRDNLVAFQIKKCQEADRLSKARQQKREEEPNHVGPTPQQFQPGSATGNGPSILEVPDESEVGEEQEIAQKSSGIKFHGTYTIPVDPMMSEKDHVQSAALKVWRTTGYHFGHKTLYCCCQDEDKKH